LQKSDKFLIERWRSKLKYHLMEILTLDDLNQYEKYLNPIPRSFLMIFLMCYSF